MKNQEKLSKYPIRTSDQIEYLKSIITGNQYKISIIIPVYNVEFYIIDALDSIVRQTIGLEYLEVIMVDDCSTDNSGKIIDEYANKYENFISIHLPENSGAAGRPRNVGIEKATGEYLMFLDPDDYYADDACEVLYDKIKEENVDMVFGKYVFLYPNRPQTSRTVFTEDSVKIQGIDDNPQVLTIPPSLWTKIYKRTFIINTNIKFPEGIPGQDLVFVAHTLLVAKGILFLNTKIILYYRVRENDNVSMTYNRNRKYISGLIQAYVDTYTVFKDNNFEDYFSIVCDNHLPYWTKHFILSDLSYSERREIFKESEFLFKKYNEYGLEPNEKYLAYLFNLLIQKKYDESLLFIEGFSSLLKQQKTIENDMNELKKQLAMKKDELTENLTTEGYVKYKSKNLIIRTKKRLRNFLQYN
jgi:glycosyltransferase involved in cell wall biosynthesis